MEVYDDNGNIVCDRENVLNKWKTEYEKLYNINNAEASDPNFKKYIKDSINFNESNMLDPLYYENQLLNKPITLNEITVVLKKAK